MVDKTDAIRMAAAESADDQKHDDEIRTKVERRTLREKTPTALERGLTEEERDAVAEHGKLSALSVYSIVMREGEEELDRPKTSLWWSGVAAGIGISTSVLAEGVIRSGWGGNPPICR